MKTPVKTNNSFISSKALKNIFDKEQDIASFLLFSGQIECDLAFDDYNITVFTNRWANYEFWDCLIKDPYRIANLADGIHKQMDPHMVILLQDSWVRMKDPFFRSALYFVLNRYSADGTVSHGSFNSNNYSSICSRSLINFYENNELDKFRIKYYKAEKYYDAFEHVKDSQVMLLPVGNVKISPLNKQVFVGHEMYDLDYGILKTVLKECGKKFVAVFKFNPKIIRDFSKYNISMIDNVGDFTIDAKLCNEIIVHNLEVP